MSIPSDLEIASQAQIRPLDEIASSMGIPLENLEPYGKGSAKIQLEAIEGLSGRPNAKYLSLIHI